MVNVNWKTKKQVLKIVVSGKGVIPCEKIDAIDALQKGTRRWDLFFWKDNLLAHSRDKQLMTMIMRIQKNIYFIKNAKSLWFKWFV